MINFAPRSPPVPVISAVTLDVDDTLVDHTTSASGALYAVGGRPGTWALWQQITDEYAAKVIAGELAYGLMHTARTKAYFAAIGDYIDDAQAEWIDSERKRALQELLRLFDDTLDFLDWLRAAGLRIGAVTNASGAHQRVKLADLGIAGFFDSVVVAGEIGCAKPEPAIFHAACAELGVDPAATLHVGDRLSCDAIGARAAGLHGLWLNRSATAPYAENQGVPMVSTLAEVPEVLVCDLDIAPVRQLATPPVSSVVVR